jgi:hypothetical protein
LLDIERKNRYEVNNPKEAKNIRKYAFPFIFLVAIEHPVKVLSVNIKIEINSKYEKIWPKRSFIKECDSRIIAEIFAIIKEYMKTSKRLKFFIMNRI